LQFAIVKGRLGENSSSLMGEGHPIYISGFGTKMPKDMHS
jgi:hypothetical protein